MRTSAVLSLAWFVAACGRTALNDASVVSPRPDAVAVADAARIAGADSAAQSPDSRSCQWTFAPQVSYPAAWGPWSLAVGDFNGDGVPDVAAGSSDETDSSAAVWLNNGDGTFAPPLHSSSPYENSWSIAAGDFNGDHKLDLAVVGNATSTGGILFGQGDGSFAPEVPLAMGNVGAVDLAAGDLDGDERPDLVIATGGQNVGVLLTRGDGSFFQEVTYAINGGASTLAIADFNGDRHPDLALAVSPNSVSVLINKGDGTFVPGVTFSLNDANEVGVVVAGDFNDDGHPDLAYTFFQSNGVAVRLNRGDGSFGPEVDYATAGNWPTGIAVADFDGDGWPDLAVANSDVSSVSVLLNAGNGRFAPQVAYATGAIPNYATGAVPSSIAAADFNRDGHPDLAVANSGDQTLGILLSECR